MEDMQQMSAEPWLDLEAAMSRTKATTTHDALYLVHFNQEREMQMCIQLFIFFSIKEEPFPPEFHIFNT